MREYTTGEFARRVVFVHVCVCVHACAELRGRPPKVQETVDALEYVRQLFEAGCIHSAFWHRFAATAHSPIGRDPAMYGLRIVDPPPSPDPVFAVNEIAFEDEVEADHDALGKGLNNALYNYMHGNGLERTRDLRKWFPIRVPRSTVPKNFIAKALASAPVQAT